MPLFTILAEGRRYALLGDDNGVIVTIPKAELHRLSSGYKQPILVPAPPADSPKIGKYRPTVLRELPPDAVIYCEYYTDELSRITIYKAFYGGKWYLRELRLEDGTPSGRYYREEG